jgi:hypothetical protein
MNVHDAGGCMLQYPLVPIMRNQGIKTEKERYAGMSDKEKAAFREKLIEDLHARNVCYAGCFLPEYSSEMTEDAAEKEHGDSKTREGGVLTVKWEHEPPAE